MAAMSELERCAKRIAKRTTLGTKGALDLLVEVSDRADRMRQTGVSDPIVAAAHDLASRKLDQAQTKRLDALRSASKRAILMNDIRPGGIAGVYRALQRLLVWTPLGGGRLNSIEAKGDWLSRAMIAPMISRLRRDGLLGIAIQGQLDHEVAEAIWRKRGGAPDANVKISAPAQKIADEIYKPLNYGKNRLNGVGTRIGDATDYVTKTNWNPRQLRAAAGPGASGEEAFRAWWAKDGPRMADKTFENLTPLEGETLAQAKERFGRAVWEGRVTGIVHTYRGPGMADDYVPYAFEGTRNLAEMYSHERTIYWKSAKDWSDHMRDFGGGHSIYYNALSTLMQTGRHVALMDALGTNPRASWNMLLDSIRHEYRTDLANMTLEQQEKFKGRLNRLDRIMDRLDGTTEAPHNKFLAELTETAALLENMGKLGFVQATHAFAAPMTVSAELAHHGVNQLSALPKIVSAMLEGRGPEELQEVKEQLAAYTHGGLAALHGSYSQSSPGVPGFLSWVHANFMRATGLPLLIDRFQTNGVKAVLSNMLGRAENFAALNEHQQALLKRYGMNAEDFNLLRAAEADGRKYLTPDAALRVDDAAVEARLRAAGQIAEDATPERIARQIRDWKWDQSDRLGMYLNDAAQHATVTPGARERAMVFSRLAPGSIQWMLMRSLSQFKMWPLAAFNQIIMREFGLALSNKQIATGLFSILGMSVIGGAMRMATRDMAAGRPQRDYTNPNTLLAALAQGGGLGLYGDFLFGETSRFGAGFVSSLMGPMAADMDTLSRMLGRFRKDLHDQPDKAMQHLYPDLAHNFVNHLPFANLIYLKGALDYMLFFHLYEAASPGFWDRTNRRLMREQGRVMSGYQPGAPIPHTPWAIGAPTFQPQGQ
jgi:hypothetical protein